MTNGKQCCFGLFLQASGHGTLLVSDGMIICVYMFCMCVPAVCVPLCHLYPAGFSSSAWQQWPASSAGRGWRATHPGWSCYPTHNHPPAKHTHTHKRACAHTQTHKDQFVNLHQYKSTQYVNVFSLVEPITMVKVTLFSQSS